MRRKREDNWSSFVSYKDKQNRLICIFGKIYIWIQINNFENLPQNWDTAETRKYNAAMFSYILSFYNIYIIYTLLNNDTLLR